MKKFVGKGFGKLIVINMQRGDLFLEGIEEQLAAEGIRYGIVLCAIGTLEKASFHRVVNTDQKPIDEYITLESSFELSSLQGLIIDGVPHLHATFADLEKVYAVHLEYGSTVLYTMEILIAEINGLDNLIKENNSEGIAEFYLK